MRNTRKTLVVAAASLCLALGSAGCGGSNKTKATNKKQAEQRWNSARAGVMLTLARDQYAGGNFDKCRKTIDDALKLDPQNPQLRMLSAKLSLEQGQLELAERELLVVREKLPTDAESRYLGGVIYPRWQKPQAAYEMYAAAGERAPAELAYLLAEAEMLVSLDRQAEALTLLQTKVVYFESSPAIRDAVGQLLARAKRYREAADVLRQASILAADDNTIRERLGMTLYHDKQFKEAADVLEKLMLDERFATRSDLYAVLGESQLQVGRYREARANYERAVELDPASGHLYLGLGRAAMECNDLKRAELALRKAQSIDPQAAEAHLMTGYLRLRQNRMKEALAAFQKAATLDRKDSVALCMIGYVYEKTGRGDLAMQYYGRALKVKPNDDLASRLMASVNLND